MSRMALVSPPPGQHRNGFNRDAVKPGTQNASDCGCWTLYACLTVKLWSDAFVAQGSQESSQRTIMDNVTRQLCADIRSHVMRI